jgi:hypothetical protein
MGNVTNLIHVSGTCPQGMDACDLQTVMKVSTIILTSKKGPTTHEAAHRRVSSSLYGDEHNSNIKVGIIYGMSIKTIYNTQHTSHEYTIIIHDDTFMKNVNVQFFGILCRLCHFM